MRWHDGFAATGRRLIQALKIAIATSGRFHVLDLARELDGLGHEVKFYSYVPRARARIFGLPERCHVSLLPMMLPALLWERYAPQVMPLIRERFGYWLLNRLVIWKLQPCDIFVCMSGMYLEAAVYAKERYGARIWLERGSRHILSQGEILSTIPGATLPTALTMRRELAGYALADRIGVPAKHVEESFAADINAAAKTFRNPYGVDLAMFPQRGPKAVDKPFSLLCVGTWSLRKGCDLLEAAVRSLEDVRLTHVGAIGDLNFPAGDRRFVHHDSVAQTRLSSFYAAADAFVLASREEGLAIVLVQALASGLPIICSERSGGDALAHTPELAKRVTVIPVEDVASLAHAIASWKERLSRKLLAPLADTDRKALDWAAYAVRANEAFHREIELRASLPMIGAVNA